ncbi:MAG: N-acetyl-gamma-glutamyl-phosphate reductase [Verrucomicrobia bacterium]|nr:N-acetyl-gamma-glutamyl-phosphate reductase [Verrucomicrobiota bacterium]
MIRAKVIGATGYGGVGICELLLQHPEVTIGALVAIENVGKPLSDSYPHLAGHLDTIVQSPNATDAQSPHDVVFMSTPDRVGMKLAQAELEKGAKVIDYSGDFRFNDADGYADYAARLGLETQHAAPDLLPQSVYGLPELHRQDIRKATRIIGNPGCFAVSCTLGLAPAVQAKLIETQGIICDCKTAISGAGKKLQAAFHYPARYENMNAYRLSGHQHVCEIERELGRLAGTALKITFTAQAVPMCRGIMSTLYGTLAAGQTQASVLAAYREFYHDEPFVRVYDHSAALGTIHVRGTNRCNLVVGVDERAGRFRVVSYIDNLMKGQAGSALQNMNILFGFPETTGLDRAGTYP